MSTETNQPIAGYTGSHMDSSTLREWNNVDLFDTLNDSGIQSIRNYDSDANEHILAALLTLNAQNQMLSMRIRQLENRK